MKRRTAWIVLAVATIVLAHEGHKAITSKGVRLDDKGRLHMEPPARRAVGLTVAKVDFGTIEQILRVNARATLPPNARAFASTRVEGVVKALGVKPGMTVKAGDVLAHLESVTLQALQLELDQLKAEKRLIDQNLQRAKELGEAIVAGRDVLELETRQKEKQLEIETTERKLAALGDGNITSPLDGVVVHVDVQPGQHVDPTQHLFEVVDLRTVWLEAEVPEADISLVKVDQEVRPGGKVLFVGSRVEENSRSVHVWCEMPNPDGKLKPGMYLPVEIVVDRAKDVYVAPLDAVVTDGAERYAFVQEKEGIFVRKNLILGRRDAQFVEIVDGLYPGDIVATDGNHELSTFFVQGTFRLSLEARKNIGLKTEEVGYRRIDEIVRVNGVARAPVGSEGTASARTVGRIAKIHVTLGQQVKAGDPLADIESFEFDSAELELHQAERRLELLKQEVALIQSAKNVIPRKEVLKVETELARQESAVLSLRRRLAVLGGRTLRAPVSGQVVELRVARGQVVRPGDEIARVADLSRIWVELAVFENDLERIAPGKMARARFHTGFFEAPIGGLSHTLVNGAMTAWFEIENKGILPGMRAEVTVTVSEPLEEVIAVPVTAVLSLGGRHYVFVEDQRGFKRVDVELGRRGSRYVQVVRGIFPGDRVAISGLHELNNAHSAVK